MDVSIVVPFYNEARYIEESIKALLSQDYPSDQYEIIMVDNNSTDGSSEIVRRHPRIKLLSELRPGDFAARNRGIAAAEGEVIAFTDGDTAPFTDWLQNGIAALRDPDVGVAIGSLHYPPKSQSLSMISDYESERAMYTFSSGKKEIYYGYTCNMMVRKSLFAQLGTFPAVYRNSDTVFVRRVVDAYSCDAVCYAPDVCVRRLEIPTLWAYYCKLYTYGRDFHRLSSAVCYRPLNTHERFQFFKQIKKSKQYSLTKSVFLFPLLVAGALSYEVGRLRGAQRLKLERGKVLTLEEPNDR